MRKSIELGDSGAAVGVTTMLWLLSFAALTAFFRHRLHAAVILLLGYFTALPLGFLRRRFGRRLLIVTDHDFRWLPHGKFGPYRTFAFSAVRSVSEWRLTDHEGSPLPSWSLVLHMIDGTEVRLSHVSTPAIHEIVDALNAAIRSETRTRNDM